jgi:hypothetical protein
MTATLENITIEMNNILESLCGSGPKKDENMKKLFGYCHVETIFSFCHGRFYRWITKTDGKLWTGGILVDVRFFDGGVNLLFKTTSSFKTYFRQIPLDSAVFFQKMTAEDQIRLLGDDL